MAENFFSGFSQGFNQSRQRKTLKEQLRLQEEKDVRNNALRQNMFDQQMKFREDQAAKLDEYRAGQQELEQKKLDIQMKQADLTTSQAMMKAFDPTIPKAARGLLLKKTAQAMGVDPNSDDYKDISKALLSFDDEQLGALRGSLAAMLPEAKPGEITAFATSIMSGKMTLQQLTDSMGKLSTRKSEQAIMQGLTGDQPSASPAVPSGGRLLAPTPMAQQGGNMPIPGMEQPGGATPAKPAGQDPTVIRQRAAKAMQAGNSQLAGQLLQMARDIEGEGTGQQGKYGPIPPGYRLNNGTLEAVPGGPAATKLEEDNAKKTGLKEMKQGTQGIVLQETGRIMNMVDNMEDIPSGIEIAVRSRVPGDPFYQINGLVDTIKANVSKDSLQEMRMNSPTGGALGNVSDKDMDLLGKLVGNLDVALLGGDPEVFKDNIKRIRNTAMDIVNGTPAEIKKLVDDGKLKPEEALPLLKREKLSFDEQGNPVNKKPKKEPVGDAGEDGVLDWQELMGSGN